MIFVSAPLLDFFLAVLIFMLATCWQLGTYLVWRSRKWCYPSVVSSPFHHQHRKMLWITLVLQLPILYYLGVFCHAFYLHKATHLTLEHQLVYAGITLPAGAEVVTYGPFDLTQLKSASSAKPFLVKGLAVSSIEFDSFQHRIKLTRPSKIEGWLCDSTEDVQLSWGWDIDHDYPANTPEAVAHRAREELARLNPQEWYLAKCTLVPNQHYFGISWPKYSEVTRTSGKDSLSLNSESFLQPAQPVQLDYGQLLKLSLDLNNALQIEGCQFKVGSMMQIGSHTFVPDQSYYFNTVNTCPLRLSANKE